MNLVAPASRRRVGRASRPAIELAARRRLHSQPGTAAPPWRRFRGSMREIRSREILADGHPAAGPGARCSRRLLPGEDTGEGERSSNAFPIRHPLNRPSSPGQNSFASPCALLPEPARSAAFMPLHRPNVEPPELHANTIFVVAALSSQPRVGSAVTDEMSLIEICRPSVRGFFTSTFSGSHVCCEIFWCGAGL